MQNTNNANTQNKRRVRTVSFIPRRNKVSAIVSLLIILIGTIESIVFLKLNITNSLIVSIVLLIFYAILLAFLLRRKTIRIVEKQTVKEIIKEVKTPVIKETIREIDRPIYITNPLNQTVHRTIRSPVKSAVKKKLNIPKYNFFGSTETKTFHKSSCRLRKLIKPKYKVSNNSKSYFLSRNFKPCKVCLKK